MKVDILYFNQPTLNGRIYTKESILEAKKQGTITVDSNVVGMYHSVKIEEDKITCEIVPGTILETIIKMGADVKYTSRGLGKLKEGNIVTDYILNGVDVSL